MERMPECVVEKEFERLRGYDIVSRAEDQDFCEEICEWALRAFVSVTGQAMQTQNTDSMADFLDDGGCEALILMLNKHAATNQEIAANGCLVLCILVWSLREMKEFLGEIGACESVVYVASLHVGDPLVSEYGSGAIALLGKNNIANSLRLSDAGAIDVLAQIGNFGFNLRHPRCLAVASNVCLGIACLSEAANATKLLDCGMPGLLVALMRFHKENEEFAAASLRAMCSLSSLNVQHREELGRCGGSEIIIEVIQQHDTNTSILLEGCETMLHMSLSPNNSTKLSGVGACELLVEALRDKLMNVDFGAEVCTGAMLNLSLYGTATKESRSKLVVENAIEVLRNTQLSTKASYRARENILKLLELFGNDMPPSPHITSNGLEVLSSSSATETPVGKIHNNRGSRSASWDSSTSGSNRTGSSYHKTGISAVAEIKSSNARLRGNSTDAVVKPSNSIAPKAVRKSSFVGVIHGSEMKGDTVPLQVEVREVIEYDSFTTIATKQRAFGDTAPIASNSKHIGLDPSSPGYPRQDSEDSAAIRNSSGVYEI